MRHFSIRALARIGCEAAALQTEFALSVHFVLLLRLPCGRLIRFSGWTFTAALLMLIFNFLTVD
jgi:hypothetical protein